MMILAGRAWKVLVLTAVLGGVLGFASFKYLPQKYTASGSLLVSRKAQSSGVGAFSYEGYYAQQTARGYAETLIGFLESTDARKKALERLGVAADEINLRQAKRHVRAKKSAPQVVTLEVRRYDAYKAEDYWEALVAEVMEISTDFNNRFGDPLISVNLVDGSPVVYAAYRNVYINTLVGVGLGLTFGLFAVFTKEYLK